MQIQNTKQSYGLLAWLFHWVLAILVILSIVGGYQDAAMPDGPEKWEAIALHKSMGLLILLLVLSRLFWRLRNPAPRLPEGTSPLRRLLAYANHGLLYFFILLQPASGILMSVAAGYPPNFFGLWQMPQFMEKSESLSGTMHSVHEWGWVLLSLLISLHLLAALHHQFFLKDGVLKRMLRPGATA